LEREGLLGRRLLMGLSFEEQGKAAAYHPKVQATDTLSRLDMPAPGPLYG